MSETCLFCSIFLSFVFAHQLLYICVCVCAQQLNSENGTNGCQMLTKFIPIHLSWMKSNQMKITICRRTTTTTTIATKLSFSVYGISNSTKFSILCSTYSLVLLLSNSLFNSISMNNNESSWYYCFSLLSFLLLLLLFVAWSL